jgi:hypothetical protein
LGILPQAAMNNMHITVTKFDGTIIAIPVQSKAKFDKNFLRYQSRGKKLHVDLREVRLISAFAASQQD